MNFASRRRSDAGRDLLPYQQGRRGPAESESIQNQKSLLLRYAVEKGWDIHGLYCDEDYSEADRDRPAFRRLISDAEQKIRDYTG